MIFTKEQFVQQYFNLSQSNNQDVRNQANTYIMQFLASNQAWSVSREIIYNVQNQELQFIGTQILYKKIHQYYTNLNEQEKEELKQFLFHLLNDPQLNLQLASIKQICSSLGVLAIITICSTWQSFVDDLIKFMQISMNHLIYGLEILESLIQNLDTLMIEQTHKQKIKKHLQQKEESIYTIFNSLLNTGYEAIVNKCIDCLELWVGNAMQLQILNEPNLMICLLQYLENIDIYFEKVANLLIQVFEYSNNKDILLAKSLDQTVEFTNVELGNLKAFIISLGKLYPQFNLQINKRDSDFCRTYQNLLVQFLSKFNIFLINKNEYSEGLFQMILACTQHINLKVSAATFDFWIRLREEFKSYFPIQQQQDTAIYIMNAFLQLVKIVLNKCQFQTLKNNQVKGINLANQSQQQQPDDDNDEEFTLQDYRESAQDIFLHSFMAMEWMGIDAIAQFLQIPIDKVQIIINNTKNDHLNLQDINQSDYVSFCCGVEVALLMVKSIMSHTLFHRKDHPFINTIIQTIFNNMFPNEEITINAALQIIYDCPAIIYINEQIFLQIVQFTLNSMANQNLQRNACLGFQNIVQNLTDHDYDQTYNIIHSKFQEYIFNISDQTNLNNFSQGVITFGMKFQQIEKKQQSFSFILNIVQGRLQNFNEKIINKMISESDLVNLLNILVSIFQSINIYQQQSQEVMKRGIASFCDKNLSFINMLFQVCGNINQNHLETFVGLFQQISKIMSSNMPQQIKDILNISIKFFFQSPQKNHKCLYILISLLEDLSPQHQALCNWLQTNFNEFLTQLLNYFSNKVHRDTDLVRNYYRIINKCLKFNDNYIFSYQNFQAIINLAIECETEIVEYEMNKEILIFFIGLIKNNVCKDNNSFRQNQIKIITQGVFTALPSLQTNLIFQIILFVSNLFTIYYKEDQQSFQQLLDFSLSAPVYQQMQQEYRQTFIQAVNQFCFKNQEKSLKLTIQDLQQVANKTMNENDARTAIELRLTPVINI